MSKIATPRRIALIAPNGSRVGGAESHVLDLAESLASRGQTVTVIHRTPGHDPVPGVSFVYVSREHDPQATLTDLAADILHVHDDGLAPGEAPRAVDLTPTVRSLHNWWFGCSTGTLLRRDGGACPRAHGPGCLFHISTASCTDRPNPLPALSRWRHVASARQHVREANMVIVYSNYARRVALRNGVPEARCQVLRYFVDAPAAVTSPPRSGHVCMVGRLTKLKGVDTLLEGVARANGVEKLTVVGDGYYRHELSRRARRLGIGRRVEFVGWQDAVGTRSAMRSADLVAVPSSWPEPFGIVGLEAMAEGRAVVGADVGGIPEWLEDGVTGRLVPPGDPAAWAQALDAALGDPATLERWGRAGATRVRAFSRGRHVEALEQLYAAVTARSR